MKNSIRFTAIVLSIASFIFYSCQKEVNGGNSVADISKPHAVTVYLTDHQTPVFDSVFIDLYIAE
jgi:hypothetical protein